MITALIVGCAVTPLPDTSTTHLALPRDDEHICSHGEDRTHWQGPAAVDITTECIHYDPLRMQRIGEAYGYSVVVAIWAHETAHVYQARRGDLDDVHDFTDAQTKHYEQEADTYAGCVLAAAGMSLKPTVAWFRAEVGDSDTHGTVEERVTALRDGARGCEHMNE